MKHKTRIHDKPADKSALLDSVLAQIPVLGWTEESLTTGAKAIGMSASAARRLFPGGILDVVSAFHERLNEAMHKAIKGKRKFAVLRVRDKVAFCVQARLEAAEPYRAAMQGLGLWSVMPKNMRTSAKLIWNAADEIWRAAGDTSDDYNFYTKRILLIAVMKTTLAFWLADTSSHHKETWAFLARRIENVMMLGKGIGMAKTAGVDNIVSFIRTRFAA